MASPDTPIPGALATLSRTFLEAHRALPPVWRARSLGLCVSAGGDSSALAFAAAAAEKLEPTEFSGITLLHARHELRGEASHGDALAARELAGRLGLPYRELNAVVIPGPALEARAREARYRALREDFNGLLVTAHHRRDQAETVLMRLLRQSGPFGLRGIAPLREDGVWRPFLGTPRETLCRALAEAGWTPREDASNASIAFTRNLLRHRVLPFLEAREPGWEVTLAELAAQAASLRPHLLARLEILARETRAIADQSGFQLELAGRPDAADDPELGLLLEQLWRRTGRRPWSPSHLRRLLQDAAAGRRGRRRGGQGEIALFGCQNLRIEILATPPHSW